MDFCKGLEDWFYCLRCPFLCTKRCPIEHDDAIQKFYQAMQHEESGLYGPGIGSWGEPGIPE